MDNDILQRAADQYRTPFYVFDLDTLALRIRHIKEMLGEQIRIYYAMKANPFLTRAAAGALDGLEVCSPGEYAICRRAGISPDKIVLSGVNKEEEYILDAIHNQKILAYTAESPGQLRLLEECASRRGGVSIRVLLRLTSGNQFGMDEDRILSVIEGRNSFPHLDIAGLQYYSGTQKKDMGRIRRELLLLDSLICKIREEHRFHIRELEYGPGFPISYFAGENPLDEDQLLSDFKKALDSLNFKGIFSLEAGRFLAAPCGSYVTRVVDRKTNRGQNYCIVDGGINHVNYYGQAMAMKIPAFRYLPQGRAVCFESVEFRGATDRSGSDCCGLDCSSSDSSGLDCSHSDSSAADNWTICGSLCTSGDILVKNLPLPGLQDGDLLVFDCIGAYSVTEGIYLFLSRKLPNILTYTENSGLRLVRGALPTDPINDGSWTDASL